MQPGNLVVPTRRYGRHVGQAFGVFSHRIDGHWRKIRLRACWMLDIATTHIASLRTVLLLPGDTAVVDCLEIHAVS